jgi:hypothetical protein
MKTSREGFEKYSPLLSVTGFGSSCALEILIGGAFHPYGEQDAGTTDCTGGHKGRAIGAAHIKYITGQEGCMQAWRRSRIRPDSLRPEKNIRRKTTNAA